MNAQIEINWRLFHAWLVATAKKNYGQRICLQHVLKLSILQAEKPTKVLLGSMSWAFFPATRKLSSLSMYCNSCVLRCCYGLLSPEITLPRFTPTTISKKNYVQRICGQHVLKLSVLQAEKPTKVLLCSMSWAFFPAIRKLSSLSMYCNSRVLRCCYGLLSPEITLPRFNFTPTTISKKNYGQRICGQHVLKLSVLQAEKPTKVLLGSMSWAFFPAIRKLSSLSMYCNSCVLRCCYGLLSPEITLPRFNFTPTAISIAPTINSPPQNILSVPCTHSAPRGRWGPPWRSFAISKRLDELGSLWRFVVWGSTISFVVSQIDILAIVEGHHAAEALV